MEAYIVNSLEKTPVGLDSLDTFFVNMFYFLEIYGPSGQLLHESQTEIEDSTVSFTYKLPSDAPGGEYIIKLFNSNTPTIKKLIRVRDYDRDQLVTVATTSRDSYFPGDTV